MVALGNVVRNRLSLPTVVNVLCWVGRGTRGTVTQRANVTYFTRASPIVIRTQYAQSHAFDDDQPYP